MTFPLIDLILVALLGFFIAYGLFYGLIRTFGVFAGVILGAIIASRTYIMVADWIEPVFFGYNNLGKVLTFIILFTAINRLVGFLFYLLDKTFKIISILPFLKTFNRLGGGIMGFVTGSLTLGLVIYVTSRYSFLTHWFGQLLADSQIAPFMLKVNNLLLPLLPEFLKKLQSLI
jgi:uncharacterized membrane protein required for colicin V production